MFNNILIKWLGGVPESEHQRKVEELNEVKEERDLYKEFTKSVYVYAGNYPAWKAQSEFRQLMSTCDNPVKDDPVDYSNKSYLDGYLGRIVDGLQTVIHKQKKTPDFVANIDDWSVERLAKIRGNEYVVKPTR